MSTPNSLTLLIRESKTDVLAKIKLYLRIAVGVCFIGHGMWGIVYNEAADFLLGKDGWMPLVQLFGFNEHISWALIPLIGLKDILCGIMILYSDNRWLIYWLIFWALFTALLRPVAGFGMVGYIERAGNYGPAIALLYFLNNIWKKELSAEKLKHHISKLELILRICLSLLIMGHAGLVITDPILTAYGDYKALIANLGVLNYPTDAAWLMALAVFEMTLSLLVLFWPRITGLMLFVLIFKVFSEGMYAFAYGPYSIFETIERIGDYLIPLILMVIYKTWSQEDLA